MTPTRQPLSPKQTECLKVVTDHIDREGYPPSLREICAAMGIRSTNGAAEHLAALERKGWIERVGGKSRGVRVISRGDAVATQLERDRAAIDVMQQIQRRADVWESRARALGWTDAEEH